MPVILRLKQQIARLYYKAAQVPLVPILHHEWSRRDRRSLNERTVEYAFALDALSRSSATRVLDVGSGTKAWPQLLADCGYQVTAIDEGDSYWGVQPVNRHHHLLRDDITAPTLTSEFDAVTCISVLEHIPDHDAAVRGLRSLLKRGGHAIVSVPYNDHRFVENVYSLRGVSYGTNAPYVCRVYSRAEVRGWLDAGFEVVRQSYYRVFTGELWAFGERLLPPVETGAEEPHHLSCLLLRAV